MDVPQGLVFIFYMFVAFFAIGTILKGFFQVRTAEAVVNASRAMPIRRVIAM